MFQELRVILENLHPLSDEAWHEINSCFKELKFDKGEIITEAGQIENWLYFTVQGGTRAFYLKEGEEHCIDFRFENEFTGSYISFLQQEPSRLYVQTLEQTTLYAISYHALQKLYTQSKIGENLGRLSAEKMLIKYHERQASLILDTATERFSNLLNNQKTWVQRVPQKHLASYLNITPEYYSRLKKNHSKATSIS